MAASARSGVCVPTASQWHADLVAAHLGVHRRGQHALVAGDSRQDQAPGLEVLQQQVQRRGEERRVHRLEHEVVVVRGRQPLGDLRAQAVGRPRVAHQCLPVRAPAAFVVVGVDRRNPVAPATVLQGGDALCDGEGCLQHLVGVRVGPAADHVDDEQHRGAFVLRCVHAAVPVDHGGCGGKPCSQFTWRRSARGPEGLVGRPARVCRTGAGLHLRGIALRATR